MNLRDIIIILIIYNIQKNSLNNPPGTEDLTILV